MTVFSIVLQSLLILYYVFSGSAKVAGAIAWGGIWLGITMLAACLAHIRVKDSIGKTVPPVVFLVLIVILTIIHADGLMHSFL